MLKRMITTHLTVLAAVVFFSVDPNTLAQSKLSAKRSFQPQPASVVVESDRVKDGLVGPVRRVRTEVVKLASQDGKLVEGKRALLEVVAYDIKGNKTENQYFPVAGGTLTGKEVYKYDEKGNISEMTMLNDDGSLLSRETYKYEFDFAGNWKKMTASVAVVDSGRIAFEPTEITYRSIMYYLDENMVKMAQPNAPSGSPATQPNSAPASATESKPQPPIEVAAAKQPANKTAQVVPQSSLNGETLSAGNPVEIKNVASNSPGSPKVVLDAEPPPSAAPRPILRPISGGVLNGAATFLPSPVYPDTAKRMRTSGVVIVEVVIDENGKVISAKASDGPSTLREPAVRAALRARFSPTKLTGQPVKVLGTISYKFTLAQ